MKRLFTAFCFILFLFVPVNIYGQASAQTRTESLTSITGEHIEDYRSEIKVNKDGTIDVTENILYDFDTLDRHGIYRIVPYLKTNRNGKQYEMDLQLMAVKDEKGHWYNYDVTKSDGKLEVKIGDPDRTITGKHTYVITYKVSGALTYFSEHDELNWNITGNDWGVPIVNVTSTVTLPESITKDVKTACYTGPLGSIEAGCTATVLGNTTAFTANDILNSSSGMTIVVGFPKGQVVILEPKEVIPFFNTLLGKVVLAGLFLAALYWYLVLPVQIGIKWFRDGRDPKVDPPVTAYYDPPKTKDGRFMTPAELGVLIDEHAEFKDISGLIIDLARRGNFKIQERKKNDFYFIKTREFENDTTLLYHEKYFLEEIFKNGRSELRLKEAKLYSTVEEVKKMLYEKLVNEGMFPEDPNAVRTRYSVLAFLGLFTLNAPLTLSSLLFGMHMPRRTLDGAKATQLGISLRNFLTSQGRQLAFQAKNQMLFEKLLPFAIVFGVEKIWAERFSDLKLKPPEWYEAYDQKTFNTVSFTRGVNSSFGTVRSAASPPTSTSSTSGFSSGFSGGSSGGGGGGGGGGSW